MNSRKPKKIFSSLIYFGAVLLGVFIVSFTVLYALGLVPKGFEYNPPINLNPSNNNSNNSNQNNNGTLTSPDRITIDKIGVDSIIGKPQSQDVSILDQYLANGAVYYPGSGYIEQGNIFLFGHSTNWQVVQNQAYKTFNGLDKLSKGDVITLEAGNKNYLYKVTKVTLVDANSALVEFNNSGRNLTISTCNTFGQKQERWVVDAEFWKEA